LPILPHFNFPIEKASLPGANRPLRMLLDTGAPGTWLDPIAVDELGVNAALARAPAPLRVLESEVPVTVGQFPVRELTANAGITIDGVVGVPFLLEHDVCFDYLSRQITVTEPSRHVRPPNALAVAVRPGAGLWNATVTVGDTTVTAVVDTGNSGALLLGGQAPAWTGAPSLVTQGVAGLGGKVRAPVFRADLQLGGRPYPGALVIAAQKLPAVASVQAVLGQSFLSRFAKVTFRFSCGEIVLEPRESTASPEPWDRSGLDLIVAADAVVAGGVDLGTPAYAAGLRGEDVLVEVGDLPATPDNMGAIADLLRGPPGTPVVLRYQRGATAPTAVRFLLADLL